jgi:TetR/AcrR family fatty acid metabolism transcriptional regulator
MELKNYLDLIGEIVEEGRLEGIFRHEISKGLAKRFIFGAIDEVVSTSVLAGMHYELEPLAERLLDLFLRGMEQERGEFAGQKRMEGEEK